MNHHRARVRSCGNQLAPSAHSAGEPVADDDEPRPALVEVAEQRVRGQVGSALRWPAAARGGLLRLRLGVGLGGDVDELGDLVVGEAGEPAELAGEVDRVLVVLAAEAAEAEQLVDRALELERLLAAARGRWR